MADQENHDYHRQRAQEGHYPCAIPITPHQARQVIAAIESSGNVLLLSSVLVELSKVVQMHDAQHAVWAAQNPYRGL